MADELSLRVIARLSTDVTPDHFDESITLDQGTENVQGGGQTVGTTHEVLSLGDVAAPSVVILRNADATNFCALGIDQTGTFVPVTAIGPGEVSVVKPASGVTLYVRADTAPVRLDRFIPSA